VSALPTKGDTQHGIGIVAQGGSWMAGAHLMSDGAVRVTVTAMS